MNQFVASNHPVQRLIFFIAQDVEEPTRIAFDALIDGMAELREWQIGPPQKIVDRDDESLVGGCIEIYSAQSPNEIPKGVDMRHFREVTAIIEVLKRFSYEHMLAIEFELDGKFVGALEDGEMDRSLREGLIDEWKRHLDEH